MKMNHEQQEAFYEARRAMVRLRAACEHGEMTTAAKALWADVSALIATLDPEWDVHHALVAGKVARVATDIVGDIERDTDCRSLFDGVDSDVRDEILHGWREIVLNRLKEAT
jgi:hypothetical protein